MLNNCIILNEIADLQAYILSDTIFHILEMQNRCAASKLLKLLYTKHLIVENDSRTFPLCFFSSHESPRKPVFHKFMSKEKSHSTMFSPHGNP